MEAKLRGLISNYDVSIFSLSYCPWCMRAKRLTDGMGPRSVVEVDLLMDRGNPMRTTVDAALRAIIKKGRRRGPPDLSEGVHLRPLRGRLQRPR
jgi:glutaredoxin